jgi:predicted dehydrogenase
MIGVAIIGAGDIANIHIEALKKLHDRCKIVVLSDIYEDKAKEKAGKYDLDCEIVGDYRNLLLRSDIDLVSICLPPSMHCSVVLEFLSAGKNVLCEKPMAPTLEECDKMIECAKKSGKKLSIIAQNRFKTDTMRTKMLIDSKVLGDIYFAQINSLWWRGDNYYDLWWRGTWEKEGGGCTFIHAVHHIDLMLWYMGDIKEVNSAIFNQNHKNSEVEDLSITTVKFKNNAVGLLTSSLLHHGEEQKFVIDAENGTIEIPHKIVVNKQMENGYPEADENAKEKFEKMFMDYPALIYTDHLGQIENMLSSIEKNIEPLITGIGGRKTIEFISGVYQSAFTGEKTKFPMTEKDLFYTKAGIMSKITKFNEKKKSVENFSDKGISVGGTI